MQRLTVEPFGRSHMAAAGRLLAARHAAHRVAVPALDARFEAPSSAEAEIAALVGRDDADGVVARIDDEVVGFMIGIAKDPAIWGGNVWIEAAGHAARDPWVVRVLYAVAAEGWLADGRNNHHVLVPATDAGLVDAWFGLDFGIQHVHALRDVPAPTFGVVPRSELIVRRAERRDIPALAELELTLPRHHQRSPVFSRLAVPDLAETAAELEADFDDPKFTTYVAEHGGRVVGSATGCDLSVSAMHTPLTRPARAGFLGFAAVLEDARGLGAGRALGETVLAWSRDAGYEWAVTDWRSANLPADRTWRSLGFRPSFLRLHRSII